METQTTMVRACKADHGYIIKSIVNKKQGKTEEEMDRQCQTGSTSKRKRCTTTMRKREKETEAARPCRPLVGNLYV